MAPARRRNGRFSALLALSNCSRTIRPFGRPVLRDVSLSHSATSSGSRTVIVLPIRQHCNTPILLGRLQRDVGLKADVLDFLHF